MDGIDKKYIYHFCYSKKNFQIGKELTLQFSEESRLAYDRKDLVKALVFQLLETIFVAFLVWVGICYNIFLEH